MMIKKMMILSSILVAFFAMASVALAAESKTLNASATITSPTLTLTNGDSIDFGGIVTGTDATSSIVLDSSSNTSATPLRLSGEATLDGTGNSGRIVVNSNIDATLTVSCSKVESPNTTANVLEMYGDTTNTIPLSTTNVESYTPSTLDVTADTDTDLYIGGLISVVNGLPEGNYSGTVTIDVSY